MAEIKNEEEKDFLRCFIIICISLVFPLSNGASAIGRPLVAGTWTETKKCILVDFFFKLADDDV